MTRGKGVIASSHVDAHGERFTREALQSLVEQVNSHWIPIGVEHDPRIPPVGRIVSGRLVETEDGEHAVEAETEMFAEGDVIPMAVDERQEPPPECEPGEIVIRFDRPYAQSPELHQMIVALAENAGASTKEEFKKSLDPISVLTVAAAFVLGAVGSGFFNKLGEDAYEAFKRRLKAIFAKKAAAQQILIFLYAVERDGISASAQILLVDPSADLIEDFLENGGQTLQAALHTDLDLAAGIRQLTYCYDSSGLHLQFGVRRDAVPLFPKGANPTLPSPSGSLSLGGSTKR